MSFKVAPHAGARIETFSSLAISGFAPSLPMRERELKLDRKAALVEVNRSLPMRERELKPHSALRMSLTTKSLPMRERELKRFSGDCLHP